ncbi:MAG: hypothetical protein AAGC53_14285 [Actinomycetota bacterium]
MTLAAELESLVVAASSGRGADSLHVEGPSVERCLEELANLTGDPFDGMRIQGARGSLTRLRIFVATDDGVRFTLTAYATPGGRQSLAARPGFSTGELTWFLAGQMEFVPERFFITRDVATSALEELLGISEPDPSLVWETDWDWDDSWN